MKRQGHRVGRRKVKVGGLGQSTGHLVSFNTSDAGTGADPRSTKWWREEWGVAHHQGYTIVLNGEWFKVGGVSPKISIK